MELFRKSPAPLSYAGRQFEAELVDKVPLMHKAGEFITHNLFGPGRWVGKSFRADGASGFNRFDVAGTVPAQARIFSASIAQSKVDGRPCLRLVYGTDGS